jgi:hypothetical protein
MSAPLQVRSEGRQASKFAIAKITSADFSTTDFIPLIKLPPNHIKLQAYLAVKTASGAALTLSLGTSGAATGLLGATSVAAQGKTAVSTASALGYGAPSAGEVIGATPSTGTSTLLEAYVVIEYIVLGREQTTES